MATPRIRRTKQKKVESTNSLKDFLAKIAPEPTPYQKTLIVEYSEKISAELLSLPVDENGHLMIHKINAYEQEILEKTTSSLAICINSIVKNKESLKDIHSKLAHSRSLSPIIPLEYPKKSYKTKYQLKRKVIK